MHAVVGLDERVSQVVDAEAREALEGLVGVEVEVVRVAVFFFFPVEVEVEENRFVLCSLIFPLSLSLSLVVFASSLHTYPMWCSVLSVSCAV